MTMLKLVALSRVHRPDFQPGPGDRARLLGQTWDDEAKAYKFDEKPFEVDPKNRKAVNALRGYVRDGSLAPVDDFTSAHFSAPRFHCEFVGGKWTARLLKEAGKDADGKDTPRENRPAVSTEAPKLEGPTSTESTGEGELALTKTTTEDEAS